MILTNGTFRFKTIFIQPRSFLGCEELEESTTSYNMCFMFPPVFCWPISKGFFTTILIILRPTQILYQLIEMGSILHVFIELKDHFSTQICQRSEYFRFSWFFELVYVCSCRFLISLVWLCVVSIFSLIVLILHFILRSIWVNVAILLLFFVDIVFFL